MKELEFRVRESLARHAGSAPPRSMPAGTRGLVRARQAASVALVVAVATVVAVASVAVLNAVPRDADRSAPADTSPSPLVAVPPGWPAVEIGEPGSGSPSSPPRTVEGPVALVSGTVDGSAFSLFAWRQGSAGGVCLGLAGPGGSPIDERSGGGDCLRPDAIYRGGAFTMLGRRGSSAAPVARFGFVGDRVFELWAQVGDEGAVEIPLFPVEVADDLHAFLFFPPPGDGIVEAYGPPGREHGSVIAFSRLCEPRAETRTCRSEVDEVTPDWATGEIEPLDPAAWPTVVEGGDVTPYVDHEVNEQGEMDAGVITEKTPVIWGVVQGVPFSLTAFSVDGRGDWRGNGGPDGEPGPAGQLFLGAEGRYGGGGLSLYGTTPWRPEDLGLSGFGFGSGPLTAYAGVVSERVARIGFRFADGQTRTLEPTPGPAGVHAGYFVLWAPNEVAGSVEALAADGTVLARAELCVPAKDIDPDSNVGC